MNNFVYMQYVEPTYSFPRQKTHNSATYEAQFVAHHSQLSQFPRQA